MVRQGRRNGVEMIQAAIYEGALERFAGEIENEIDRRGLSRYKGTSTLDDVQKEIDSLVNTHHNYITRGDASMEAIANDFTRAKIRVELLLNNKVKQKAIGLGSAMPQVHITSDPQWTEVLAHAQRQLERFTSIFSIQISTLPSVERKKLDFQLEDILLDIEKAFKVNPSPSSAQAYMAHINQVFKGLNERYSKYASYTMQKNLQNLVDQKSAERLSLASQLKMIDDKLSNNERIVVAKASTEAMRILGELKSDSASFNTALRNQKISVIDQHLDTIRKVVDSLQFRDNLSGGQFMGAKRPTRAFYGFGDIPGPRYPGVRGTRSPFQSAPSRVSTGGLYGLGMTKSEIAAKHPAGTKKSHISRMHSHMKKGMEFGPAHNRAVSDGYPATGALGGVFPTVTLDDPPQKIADVLAENLQTAQAQGMLNGEDGAMMLRQTNMLTTGSFGGDINALDQAKAYYRTQIEKLMQNQKAFASTNNEKGGAILRSTTDNSLISDDMITVHPTYGGYALGFIGYPLVGLMAIGGVVGLMKMRSKKTSTRPSRKTSKSVKGGISGMKSLKLPSFAGLGNRKSLMSALGGSKGGGRK